MRATVGILRVLSDYTARGNCYETAISTPTCVIIVTLSLAEPSVAKPGTCPAPKLVTKAQVERNIVQSEEAWAKSVATNNASVVKRIPADDFIWGLNGKVVDKKIAVKWAEEGPVPFLSNKPDYVHVRFFGDAAVAQGSETWAKKGGTRGKFVWTDTWVKRVNCWQIVNAQDTVVTLPAK